MPSLPTNTPKPTQEDGSANESLKSQVLKLVDALGVKLLEVCMKLPDEPTGPAEGYGKPDTMAGCGAPDRLTVALAWTSARAARDKVMGADLFSDPAWNMFLDLYINHCRERPVSVSDLCIASGISATSALRWIALLEKRNLVKKTPDPSDGRRWFVSFTAEGLRKTEKSLDMAADSDQKLGLSRLRVIQKVDDHL